MSNFTFRTEDLVSDDIKEYYVETKADRDNIDFLKSNVTGLLVGSRGTGKTMLLRKAEIEMLDTFEDTRIFPVFVSFSSAALVVNEGDKFKKWMLSKILFSLEGQLRKKGLIESKNIFSFLLGYDNDNTDNLEKKINELIYSLEQSWKNGCTCDEGNLSQLIDDTDYFKILMEQICEKTKIKHIVLLFDEACHNFLLKQQREFFTLFRDLRSSRIYCKAAVYPGVTSYGTFEIFHDSVVKRVEKDILSEDYVEKMRDIIKKHIDIDKYNMIIKQGDMLNSLIYASTGNPRILLKSVYEATEELSTFKKINVNKTLKDFFRTQVWNEYTKLGEKFRAYKQIIEWGRNFIEDKVLQETNNKNSRKATEENYDKTTIYFILSQDAPELVKKSISILEYSGIVMLHTEGYKMHNNIYNRYQINIGIVAAGTTETDLIEYVNKVYKNLSIKVVTEYGENSSAFSGMEGIMDDLHFENLGIDLKLLLEKDLSILDIYDYQKQALRKAGFKQLYDIIYASESDLTKAYLIGPKRARRISNLAKHAALEYIAG